MRKKIEANIDEYMRILIDRRILQIELGENESEKKFKSDLSVGVIVPHFELNDYKLEFRVTLFERGYEEFTSSTY